MDDYRDYIGIGLFLVSMGALFGSILWNGRHAKPPNVHPKIWRSYVISEYLPLTIYGGLTGMYLLFEKHNPLGLLVIIGGFVGCAIAVELGVAWKRLYLFLFLTALMAAFCAASIFLK